MSENQQFDQDRSANAPPLVDEPGAATETAPAVVADHGAEEPDNAGPRLPFSIVGIGAAAGGIEACTDLVSRLAPDTGLAFVLVADIRDHDADQLPGILARHTSMHVRALEGGLVPEPNRIYVAPPNTRVILERGAFRVDAATDGSVRSPIDAFFVSLAAEQRNRAIGIVLSGVDGDGALGLTTIKGEGGIAIVQDPDSALCSDMLKAGILPDHADIVLPPAQIAIEISRIGRQIHFPSIHLLEGGNLAPGDEPHFGRVLALLRSVGGIDFRAYKPGTLRRRIARRMAIRRTGTLADYARVVQENRDELRTLHEDVLVSLTRFFRDFSVFESLKTDIFPGIFDPRPPDLQVRIWIAGCSTGEEAYSVAICLLEYLTAENVETAVQIFGTDASERSIEKARAGLYPLSIANDVSPERLRRFFAKTESGYQISKRVRDLCIFARQNLCNDPPFSRVNLISCRNVLIYLKPEVQRAIIGAFHYALRPTGSLLIGRSESIAESLGLFAPIDRNHKFYAKTGDINPRHALGSTQRTAAQPAPEVPASSHAVGLESDIKRAADRIILSRYAPAGAVVNADLEVLEIRGYPSPFLSISPGAPSLHLLRMAHTEILPTLRVVVRRAMETGAAVAEEVALHETPHILHQATLEVLPIDAGPGRAGHCLVLFVRASSTGSRALVSAPAAAPEEERHLELAVIERDLASTRLYLQSLIEERDTRNQELTAACEEVQSANEELQSTNEELEAAQEELQSTNEELQTVNDELRTRNHELVQTGNDLNNLLNSVNIPVVMMASDLTIRQYTPPAERILNLRLADVGRPIGDIRLSLAVDDIQSLLREVVDTLATKEIEVQDRRGKWYLLRLRPYRTADNRIDGVVLALFDIDQMRRAQDALREANRFAQAIIEAVYIPVAVLDGALRVRSANAAFRVLCGLGAPDLEGRNFTELLGMLWDWPELRDPFQELVKKADGRVLELEHRTVRPTQRYLRLAARAVLTDSEPAILVLLEDVTAQRQAERLLESDRERLAGQVRSTAEVLGRTREELRALAGRLFTSQEEERRRVARELHDDINQKIAAIGLEIERYRMNPPSDPAEAKAILSSVANHIKTLSEEVRNLSHRLHPAALEHFGLAAALKTLVEEFGERNGMVVTFRRADVPEEIPRETAAALYRVTQEALRNVAKHAGKTHVKVALEGTEEGLRLTVRDLGEGFDMDDNHRGLGLVSMEERTRLVGGRLSIVSALGEGTTVTVIVPVAPEPSQ